MKNHGFGSWLGPALAMTGIAAGFAASDVANGGAFAGLLVGSLCAIWGIARLRPARRSA